ncbi:MAG: PfkB family carbohydrate kinase [Blautia massiliensis (ex Durand et al. 2017)]
MKLIALGDNVIDSYHNTGENFPGGNAVNVAVHAARLGSQAEYLGAFGDDEMAQILIRALADNGVDSSHCPVLPGRTTKVCRYDVIEGERTFLGIVTGDTWVGPLQIGEDEWSELRTADLIVSSCNAKMPEQMCAVEALPAVFAYDFGEKDKYRTSSYYDEVCHGIDLAMFSCEKMEQAEFAALCAPLHHRGVVHVLATMGAAGQMLSVEGKIIKKATQMVQASDTMGAGDSFLAAFLCDLYAAGWEKGQPMSEQALLHALAAGQQVSARNCMEQGGFGVRASL